MAGDSISVYYGELLISPLPLEASFNWCSHNCHYCFANLNQPDRRADIKATMRLLSDYHNRQTLEAKLLQQGYGVLISNRVDPFATSNFQQSIPVMRTMTELGIPIALQTKGGRGIEEALEFLPPSCWYVSIAMLDDDLRARLEPGAPSIGDRLSLLETLTSRGHTVNVGLNPWTPEWLPLEQAPKLLKRLKDCGVHGVWTETIHFNYKQLRNMPQRGREAIGESIIKRAQKRNPDPDEFQQWLELRQMVTDVGLEVFSAGQPNRSNYFEPYHQLYPKTFGVLQDFVNWCHDRQLQTTDLISFNEFADFLCPKFPKGKLCIGHYVGATAHQVCREAENWSNWMTYRDLLQMVWSDARIKASPARAACFAYAAKRDSSGGWIQLVDDHNLPYLAFNPDGFSDYYAEV
ncbi:radical SAM protein [Oculatella sp. LEGE 06141]|uniref:radical SAM protein n=1 Tax=Oculatella sp. LEGE 06141 TaxID=1828648 RepID=UPI00187FDA5E|nr:radical SAM protein [Oculatella sp. LEGE 06141]MBE9178694.1 radical SAM protein [Oculatella sp. LEGE 06141]